MYTLNDAVRDNYEYVVSYLKGHNCFNEDVFQDTVLKCFQVFQQREINKNNVIKYFLHSYKTNLYTPNQYKRHMQTHANARKLHDVTDEKNTNIIENHIDYNNLKIFFFEHYGEQITLLLKKYNLGGYSIRELEEESGIKNLRYIFKKMTNDAKNFLLYQKL